VKAAIHSTELPITMSSAMASVTRYHDYLWSFVQPWLGRRVMEIGVGFGQYTRKMLAEQRQVLGCDLDLGHLQELRTSVSSPLLEIQRLNLEAPEAARSATVAFSPDTIILLNVLEHINLHQEAIAFLREIAAPGCRIVLIVPAFSMLHNGLDREAGHYRRYSRGTLDGVLSAAGWRTEIVRYINLPGVAGWILAGWLGRLSRAETELNAASTNWLLRLYDRRFAGLARLTDPLTAKVFGLSLVAVAQKLG